MNEQEIEQKIQDKGLNAPRLNPTHIDNTIMSVKYHVFENTTMTVCCIVLNNGFCVIGESAAASMDNFDKEIGEKIAFGNARDKIWMLEGYLLKQLLAS